MYTPEIVAVVVVVIFIPIVRLFAMPLWFKMMTDALYIDGWRHGPLTHPINVEHEVDLF